MKLLSFNTVLTIKYTVYIVKYTRVMKTKLSTVLPIYEFVCLLLNVHYILGKCIATSLMFKSMATWKVVGVGLLIMEL